MQKAFKVAPVYGTYIAVTLIEPKCYFKTSPYTWVKTTSYDSKKKFGYRNVCLHSPVYIPLQTIRIPLGLGSN